MTPTQQKAHQLKNDFGELAEKVVDLMIIEHQEEVMETYEIARFQFWEEVKNELKKLNKNDGK